jgi:hypothetical protein
LEDDISDEEEALPANPNAVRGNAALDGEVLAGGPVIKWLEGKRKET